ncbi:MAG: hypothetical protein NC213_06475 [Acetobacter sp.]|nr:hypothetical protein [Bacteroides sp.]MCM1341371.1 hypothetical protein [Acetobacter sp.]MCM1433463.1 hypothetical protein [Clostridiales bacterium]
MFQTIINEYDVFYTPIYAKNEIRSSNPYDYIRNGYFLDNATLFGGNNNVNFNGNLSGNRTSAGLGISHI